MSPGLDIALCMAATGRPPGAVAAVLDACGEEYDAAALPTRVARLSQALLRTYTRSPRGGGGWLEVEDLLLAKLDAAGAFDLAEWVLPWRGSWSALRSRADFLWRDEAVRAAALGKGWPWDIFEPICDASPAEADVIGGLLSGRLELNLHLGPAAEPTPPGGGPAAGRAGP